LLDLLRRVAVLTIISAIGIALLTPLTARSALPPSSDAARLLDAAERSTSTLDRGTLVGRDGSLVSRAAALGEPVQAIGPESFGTDAALPTPASAPMEATLYLKPTPRPAPVAVAPPPVGSGNTITGKATWYCCTLGWRGEAVVALPGALGGQYDAPPAARFVTVCADRCAQLPVVDYCGCYWGTTSQKVADLSPEAWAAVSDAPTSAGVITVTVHLGG
jgi:hypothetical protein